jgi:CRP-like cAMP-binding protein
MDRFDALDSLQRSAVLAIADAIAPLDHAAFDAVLRGMHGRSLEAGEMLLRAGDRDPPEYFLLDGILKTSVADADGREATLAFHAGPGVLMPAITRVAGDRSRVDCTAMTPARVVGFASALLLDCMLAHPAVQRWGDAVLRAELMRRADREWSLAAQPALQRLLDFRRQHADLEDRVSHHHIASYLGITPVSLSRLRAQLRVQSQAQAQADADADPRC